MILNESNATPMDLRFRLFGTHVRVHPLFWLFAAVFGWNCDERRTTACSTCPSGWLAPSSRSCCTSSATSGWVASSGRTGTSSYRAWAASPSGPAPCRTGASASSSPRPARPSSSPCTASSAPAPARSVRRTPRRSVILAIVYLLVMNLYWPLLQPPADLPARRRADHPRIVLPGVTPQGVGRLAVDLARLLRRAGTQRPGGGVQAAVPPPWWLLSTSRPGLFWRSSSPCSPPARGRRSRPSGTTATPTRTTTPCRGNAEVGYRGVSHSCLTRCQARMPTEETSHARPPRLGRVPHPGAYRLPPAADASLLRRRRSPALPPLRPGRPRRLRRADEGARPRRGIRPRRHPPPRRPRRRRGGRPGRVRRRRQHVPPPGRTLPARPARRAAPAGPRRDAVPRRQRRDERRLPDHPHDERHADHRRRRRSTRSAWCRSRSTPTITPARTM